MKRILPLILTILLIPVMLAVPARADDLNSSNWIQLLDYGYPTVTFDFGPEISQDSLMYNLSPGSENHYLHFYFDVPGNLQVNTYDVLFRTDSTDFKIGNASSYGTIISLGDNFYRAIGYHNFLHSFFYLEYTNGTYCEILSYKVSSKTFARYTKSYYGYVYDYSYDPIKESFFAGEGNTPMTPVNITPSQYTAGDTAGHVSRIYIDNWQSMDFITLNVATWSTIFSALKVEVSGLPVPYTINTVESANVQGVSLYLLDITIDLRSIDRTLSAPLSVDLSGQVKYPYSGTFAVQSCLGLVSIDPPSSDTFWFTKLINTVSSGFASIGTWLSDQTSSLVSWLSQINTSLAIGFDGVSTWLRYVHDSIGSGFSNVSTWISNQTFSITTSISTWGQNIVNAINPPADTDDMRNEVENIRDQMQDANDVMNELQRPDIDDVFHEVQLDIGTGSPFADIMSGLFANDFIVTIVTGSLAFTLFGILVG